MISMVLLRSWSGLDDEFDFAGGFVVPGDKVAFPAGLLHGLVNCIELGLRFDGLMVWT
jgi:hypothetical protein